MNLFVGFIVDGFNLNKGHGFTDITYTRLKRQFRERRPKERRLSGMTPHNAHSRWLGGVLNSFKFQAVSASCVCVNVGFMLADHAHPSEEFLYIMSEYWCECVCVCVQMNAGFMLADMFTPARNSCTSWVSIGIGACVCVCAYHCRVRSCGNVDPSKRSLYSVVENLRFCACTCACFCLSLHFFRCPSVRLYV